MTQFLFQPQYVAGMASVMSRLQPLAPPVSDLKDVRQVRDALYILGERATQAARNIPQLTGVWKQEAGRIARIRRDDPLSLDAYRSTLLYMNQHLGPERVAVPEVLPPRAFTLYRNQAGGDETMTLSDLEGQIFGLLPEGRFIVSDSLSEADLQVLHCLVVRDSGCERVPLSALGPLLGVLPSLLQARPTKDSVETRVYLPARIFAEGYWAARSEAARCFDGFMVGKSMWRRVHHVIDPPAETHPVGFPVDLAKRPAPLKDRFLERFDELYGQVSLHRSQGNFLAAAFLAEMEPDAYRRLMTKYGLV